MEIVKKTQKVAGVEVSTLVSPVPEPEGGLARAVNTVVSLWKGMRITGHYVMRPSEIVTRQYPENRATLTFPERYRARLIAPVDENGYHKCTACEACSTACPNLSIRVLHEKNAANKDEIRHLLWRMDSCTFCNACVQACPWGAIEFKGDFESAVYDRRLLAFDIIPYAGPPAKELAKAEADKRPGLMAKRLPFDAPVPAAGVAMDGVAAVKVTHVDYAKPAPPPPAPAAEPAKEVAP
jgi:NADH-quinone oxidoreductase subunit I